MVKNVKNDVGSELIRIRAHHILCIQGFQGLGYSKEFTENMARIKDEISQNPSSFIKVIIGADSICKYCPHNSKGTCNMESPSKNIRAMDYIVLENLGIEDGSFILSASIPSIAMNLSRQTVKKLCGSCSWRNNCLYFQEKML